MNAWKRTVGGLAKIVQKSGRPALISLLTLGILSTGVIPFLGNTASAQNTETAYRVGNAIKFEGFVYTLKGRETTSGREIENWSIYMEPTFTCGDFILLDNPQNRSIALRETVPSTGLSSTVGLTDCRTVAINVQPDVVDVSTQAQCEDAESTWASNTCTLVNTAGATHRNKTNGENTQTLDDSCESKGGATGWILCPVVNLLDGVLNWIDTQIQGLLEIDRNSYTDINLKRAWVSIRNIAYIILIPIMLVMVIGTALGFDIFNAYTVKKALPRMIAAILFITLSWQICTFLITFFNVVGTGILGIVTSPFKQSIDDLACQNGNLNLACLFSVESGVNGSSILHSILFIPTAAASIIGLLVFLIFFGFTLLVGIGAAFIVLLSRQIFVIALLLLSPLAILAWIFPGNDKLWKGWWSAFSKLLIMFPLIMLIIGVGRIFALLLALNPGGSLQGSIINPIAKLGAYMLPYFFIPFTFKFAGGLFANLAGVINDKNKGIFDRAKKRRHAKFERAKEGHFIRNEGREGSMRSKINKGFEKGLNVSKAGIDPRFMSDRLNTALNNNAYHDAKEAMEKNKNFAAIKGNDDFLEAGRTSHQDIVMSDGTRIKRDGSENAFKAYLRNKGYAEADINTAAGQMHAVKRDMNQEVFNRAALLSLPGTGTAFNEGSAEMDQAIYDTFGTDTLSASRAIAEMRGSATQARRADLAGGSYNNRLNAFKDVRDIKTGNHRSVIQRLSGEVNKLQAAKAKGEPIDERQLALYQSELAAHQRVSALPADQRDKAAMDLVTERIDRETMYTQSGGTIATMKRKQLETRLAPMMLNDLNSTIESGDTTSMLRQIGAIEGRHDVMNQVNPENAEVLANKVLSQQIDVSKLSDEMRNVLRSAIEVREVVTDPTTGAATTRVKEIRKFITVQQAGEAAGTNDVYRQARKEFGSAAQAQEGTRPPDLDPTSIRPIT